MVRNEAPSSPAPRRGMEGRPCEENPESRTVRIARLAVASLRGSGDAVTRTSLAERSRIVDTAPIGKRRGISEATIDANVEVRRIYEAARSWKGTTRPAGRGAIDAQIRRLSKACIVDALLLARLATIDRTTEFELALARYGRPIDVASILAARAERAKAKANRPPGSAPAGAGGQRAAAHARNAARIDAARKARPEATAAAIAGRTGLHAATVARHIADAGRAETDKALGIDPAERRRLAALPKRDVARALHTERALIRVLHRTTMRMGAEIVARDRLAIRAAQNAP